MHCSKISLERTYLLAGRLLATTADSPNTGRRRSTHHSSTHATASSQVHSCSHCTDSSSNSASVRMVQHSSVGCARTEVHTDPHSRLEGCREAMTQAPRVLVEPWPTASSLATCGVSNSMLPAVFVRACSLYAVISVWGGAGRTGHAQWFTAPMRAASPSMTSVFLAFQCTGAAAATFRASLTAFSSCSSPLSPSASKSQ